LRSKRLDAGRGLQTIGLEVASKCPRLFDATKTKAVFEGGRLVARGAFILDHPDRGRCILVLDLDPIGTPPGAIGPVAALGDDAFEPHGARVLEERVAVGRGKVLRTAGFRRRPCVEASSVLCAAHPTGWRAGLDR
jgi:hypothetical protein